MAATCVCVCFTRVVMLRFYQHVLRCSRGGGERRHISKEKVQTGREGGQIKVKLNYILERKA